MTNLVLFVATVALYFGVYYWLIGRLIEDKKDARKTNVRALVWIAVLSLPININGHIFTVFGNAQGEKGVYSVASLYQRVNDNEGVAIAVLVSGYQRAGYVATVCGISGYQQADKSALLVAGISGYQESTEDSAIVFGVSGYQRAQNSVFTGMGISVYQQAEREATTFLGLAFYQKVGNQSRAFAVWSPLKVDQTVTQTNTN